ARRLYRQRGTIHKLKWYLYYIIVDRISTSDRDLQNTSIHLSVMPEEIFDFLLINSQRLWRGRCLAASIRSRRFGQCYSVMDGLSHLYRIAMTGHMHVHHTWRFANQVIVDRSYFNPAFLQFPHDRLDVLLSYHHVP